MATRLSDSAMYAHLWSTDELDAIFAEEARLQAWLDILAALARAQAALGIIPAVAADEITARAKVDELDLDFIVERTRSTGHSTLGLIHGLELVLSDQTSDYVYFGATVQDVTDTWFGLVLRDVSAIVLRDLTEVQALLVGLAMQHRNTVMAGRTHGQPGALTTFGLKAASWADEIFRHLERVRQGSPRWAVGQLAGAVGTLAFYGSAGAELRAAFCAELGLADPGISWLTARDRVAEFGGVLAMVCSTLARIGNEIYELQRPEIGELHEPVPGVSSITMPHKRNPEISEHLDTLGRLARSSAAVLLESMVGQHERDGRTWKAEWIALPEVCMLTGAALRLGKTVLSGLEVDVTAMARNLSPMLATEQVLAELSSRWGKHRAQRRMHELLRDGVTAAQLPERLATEGMVDADEVRSWLDRRAIDMAAAMVDHVCARAST